ncbi:MAG TPA: helicase C-terminal domain-containing protein [Opitutaceae bacterium]|nr:helicase C-terminal domain-containing protein [Opitutaceae bacterium]
MQFSLDDRTCALSVGEFAAFTLGPRAAGLGGPSGVWRAQLGQEWHGRLRARTEAETSARGEGRTRADAAFEVPLTLGCVHRGWTFTLGGRIDQIITVFSLPRAEDEPRRPGVSVTLREIKTIAGPLPADERALRGDFPEYFLQAITYLALLRMAPANTAGPAAGGGGSAHAPRAGSGDAPPVPLDFGLAAPGDLRAELIFVELGTGITQVVGLTADDEALFRAQLERLVEFLDLRLQSRERLRRLRFRPAFAVLRPGQETIQAELCAAIADSGYRIPESKEARRSSGIHPASGFQSPVSPILFEAPTGYGKTGVLLEFALNRLRAGQFSRLLYLTGKSTGQLQVMRTLAAMTAPPSGEAREPGVEGRTAEPSAGDPRPSSGDRVATPVAAWQVRPKAEHCVNQTFHCVREACSYLADMELRWPQSGLARFYLRDDQPRDLETLRAAGREAHICPYEIMRASLPFNDVWIGDYNYIFAPDSRGVFYDRPGFKPAETLLIIDEAHNLPARVADAYSHVVRSDGAEAVLTELRHGHVPAALLLEWERWGRWLAGLPQTGQLDPSDEADLRDAVDRLATLVATTPLDYAALDPRVSEQLWQMLALRDWLAGDFSLPAGAGAQAAGPESPVSTLLWCPRATELHFTCLDASALIGRTLRAFGGAILTSATLHPPEVFAAACGLDDLGLAMPDAGKLGGQPSAPPLSGIRDPKSKIEPALGKLSRRARKTLRELTSGAALLEAAEARDASRPRLLQARAPWREHAYRVGIDVRVDTTFQHRSRHYAATAATVEALHAAARPAVGGGAPSEETGVERRSTPTSTDLRPASGAVAVFFPSYAYAESIIAALKGVGSPLRAALQPRAADLATQAAWVEESLVQADALLLVLGSSFAESIDLLGGRVSHAMVVGPALPEVNVIQRQRLAELEGAGFSRTAAFRRVYQIPGMQKVNQALGRLVRAPGQQACVLLHCRRFAEDSYASLLASEYQNGVVISSDEDLAVWLRGAEPAPS